MHSLGIAQWNSTRWDHSGNPGGVFGSGPVIGGYKFNAHTFKKGLSLFYVTYSYI